MFPRETPSGSTRSIAIRISTGKAQPTCWFQNEGDLYELAKILGHSNIKMTERYAKLGRKHIARTGNTAREIWKIMAQEEGNKTNIVCEKTR